MGAFLILLLIIIICWYIMRIQRKIGEFKIFIPIFMWVKKIFSDGFDDNFYGDENNDKNKYDDDI